MMARRWPRVPMPKPAAFNSSPSALAYSPLPSASIRILSPTLLDLPQAFITNTSLTAVHAMVSTPFALILSASSTKPGRCFASQVGVKAPGTEKNTTVLPLKSSSVVIFCGPSLVMRVNLPSGILSPALMVMALLLKFPASARRDRRAQRGPVQLPHLQHARTDIGHVLEVRDRLFRV